MTSNLVEVALPLPVRSTFTYSLPGGSPLPGSRVLVPFRRDERIGWVLGPGSPIPDVKVRPVLDVLDAEPSVPAELLDLARWMAGYYVSPVGQVLKTILPSVLSDVSRDYLSLKGDPGAGRTGRERRLLEALAERGAPRTVRTLRRALGMGSLWPEIRRLVASGILGHEVVPPQDPSAPTRKVVVLREWVSDLSAREERFKRAGRQKEAYELLERAGGSMDLGHLTGELGFSRSVVRGLEDKGIAAVEDQERSIDPFRDLPPEDPPGFRPTRDQARAIRRISSDDGVERPTPVLLHGVTGSGKTLVYIELLKDVVLRQGKGAIVLVPEISLTPQTVSRFRAHFGDDVAVLHSGLSDGERYDAWRQLRAGRKRIAVGARSAVFAPVRSLGAIVVDEEHDGSYKQSEGPRYQGRDVAVVRAAKEKALCLLGSATPSLESWDNAGSGKYELVSLPERVGGGSLPPVEVVDLKKVWKAARGRPSSQKERGGGVLAPLLVKAIEARLARGEQVILLLNRRGYSNFVQCRECGAVWECLRCSVTLTYHRSSTKLLCHHCRHEEPAPHTCDACGSGELGFKGTGTEQVERVVGETFPGARIARMDVDTTSGKWSHHEILGRFGRGELDILLGTQMIAKGLDFPNVTLVGVINADVGIHLPDFRASERTFQLLSQVAGRAGRGALGGKVIVQTTLPDHFAVRAALDHDFRGFAARELEERRAPRYPPHVRLANIVVSSPSSDLAASEAERSAAWFRQRCQGPSPSVHLVGPAPAPIERLHSRYRWHFLLKSGSPGALGGLLGAYVDGHRPSGKGVRVVIDRDPVALL